MELSLKYDGIDHCSGIEISCDDINWEYQKFPFQLGYAPTDNKYYHFLIDFLNEDFYSMAAGSYEKDDETCNHISIIKKECEEIDRDKLLLLVNKVIVYKNELSCSQKYSAYLMAYEKTDQYYDIDTTAHFRLSDIKPTIEYLYHNSLETIMGKTPNGDPLYNSLCEMFQDTTITIRFTPGIYFQKIKLLLNYIICEMIKNDKAIQLCPNCGKYFDPSRMDTIYCNNNSPQDKNKSCGEYKRYEKYLGKTQTDEAVKLYKQIYNQKRNMSKRCRSVTVKKDLEDFIKAAQEWKDKVRAGEKIEQEYIEWLKLNRSKRSGRNEQSPEDQK